MCIDKNTVFPYSLTNQADSIQAASDDDVLAASSKLMQRNKHASFDAYAVKPDGTVTKFSVSTGALTNAERQIIADGCLINYYRNH